MLDNIRDKIKGKSWWALFLLFLIFCSLSNMAAVLL